MSVVISLREMNFRSRLPESFFERSELLTGGDLPTGADPRGGGAISCEVANLTIKNSVITGNASQASGGGIWAEQSNLTIQRTVISGNSSGLDGGEFASTGG